MRWASLTLFNMLMFQLVTNLVFMVLSEYKLYVVFFEQLVITILMSAFSFFVVWPTCFISFGLHESMVELNVGASDAPREAAVNLQDLEGS